MEDVEIYTKHQVFRPRAMLSVGLSVAAALPSLYVYLLLGSIDLLHPLQSIAGLFSAGLTALISWLIITLILFCTLGYRITYYKVTNEKLSCLADILSLILSRRSLFLAILHGIASFSIASVLTSTIGGRYSDLLLQCHSSQWCLNEQKWFILLFCSIIGFAFSLEMSASGGYCVKFSQTEKPVMQRLKNALPSLVKASTRAVRRTSLVYYISYLLFGSTIAWIARLCLFLDDDAHLGLKSWWSAIDLTLLYQMYIAGVFTRLTWAISLFFFHACITKWARFELTESRSGASLLSALHLKQDNITKMLAFKDLAKMSSNYEDERRQRIFSLSMPGGHPKIWSTLLSVTSSSLTELLQRMEAANDRLLSAQKGIISHQVSKIETIKPGFQSAQSKVKQASAGSCWYLPSVLFKSYTDSLAGEIFYDGQKHLWSLTALSSLVTRSATEDKYGIVQQDMGDVVALLLNIHQTIESLFKMAPFLTKVSDDTAMNGNSHLIGILLRQQIKLSLEPIAVTFQPHIDHISGLSTEQKKQLRNFA